MAEDAVTNPDTFGDFARYYDTIMSHVDYDRWVVVLGALSDLVPNPFHHIDVGCGTGHLGKRLRKMRWDTVGFDLSPGMVRVARSGRTPVPAAVANMTALPVRDRAHMISCLFDSLNFLLTPDDVRAAMRSFAGALLPGGVLYFDLVTEKMVTTHFAGKKWKEINDGLPTTWDSRYSAERKLSETYITLGNGASCVVREQVHAPELIESALRDAGLTLMATADAAGWKPLRRNSIRADYVAIKAPTPDQVRRFAPVRTRIRQLLT